MLFSRYKYNLLQYLFFHKLVLKKNSLDIKKEKNETHNQQRSRHEMLKLSINNLKVNKIGSQGKDQPFESKYKKFVKEFRTKDR